MTVNAVANELGKKVLLVDFGGLAGRKSDGAGDLDADLRGLFREAKMSNAVLFFDECETVFRSR
jgi:SpoVK/Ycf46/Vps4 family AAA+-type ATPase